MSNLWARSRCSADKIFYGFFSILGVLAIFWGCFFSESSKMFFEIVTNGSRLGYFLPVLWIYVAFVLLMAFIVKKSVATKLEKNVALALFIVALIPRILLCSCNLYIPNNDFLNYLKYGQNLYFGNVDAVRKVIDGYDMPTMGGLAVFNALLAHIFSPQLLGYQIANAIMTSLICITLFIIIKEYNFETAVISGFLYAVYPSNIISSQITNNHHGATLFAYIAIAVFLQIPRRIEKRAGGGVLAKWYCWHSSLDQ